MSKLLNRRWQSNVVGSGVSRRDRRFCDYAAYLPDPLVGRRFVLDGDVAADIADAEAAIARLNAEARALVDTEALARILLRAESVASSRIEGLEIGARRLLRAEAVRSLHETSSDVTATEVLGNIDAMLYGVEQIGSGDEITVDLLLELHRRLLAGTRLDVYGGSLRQVQNWIGGSGYNPCSADYRSAAPRVRPGSHGGPLRVLQHRGPACSRTGRNRPCSVRDHPPVCGRQRSHRPRDHPPRAASQRARCTRTATSVARPRHARTRLCRRARGVSVRRLAKLIRCHRGRECLVGDLRRGLRPLSGRRRHLRVPCRRPRAGVARTSRPGPGQLSD